MSQTLCLAMMGHYKCTNQALALKLQASFSFLLQGMWNSGQIFEAAEPAANALAVKTSLAVWPNQRGAWAQPQVTVARTEGAPCQMRRKRVKRKGEMGSERAAAISPSSCSQELPYVLSPAHRGNWNIRPVLKGSTWLSTKKLSF